MATTAQRRLRYDEVRRFGSGQDPHPIPDLTEIQTRSYEAFLQANLPPAQRKDEGLEGVLRERGLRHDVVQAALIERGDNAYCCFEAAQALETDLAAGEADQDRLIQTEALLSQLLGAIAGWNPVAPTQEVVALTPEQLADLIGRLKALLEESDFEAIALAEEGFVVTPRFSQGLKAAEKRLKKWESSRKIFYKADGGYYEPGDRFVQKELAETLKRIAANGVGEFYEGRTAELLVADEPTTALDVTVQAQILALLKNLTTEFNSALILPPARCRETGCSSSRTICGRLSNGASIAIRSAP